MLNRRTCYQANLSTRVTPRKYIGDHMNRNWKGIWNEIIYCMAYNGSTWWPRKSRAWYETCNRPLSGDFLNNMWMSFYIIVCWICEVQSSSDGWWNQVKVFPQIPFFVSEIETPWQWLRSLLKWPVPIGRDRNGKRTKSSSPSACMRSTSIQKNLFQRYGAENGLPSRPPKFAKSIY